MRTLAIAASRQARLVWVSSFSSLTALVLSFVAYPVASIGIILTVPMPWTLPGLVLCAIALTLGQRALRRHRSNRAVTRREGPGEPSTHLGDLDFRFRNPSWASVRGGQARQPEGGYSEYSCVDGTTQLLNRVGTSPLQTNLFEPVRALAPLEVWLVPYAGYHLDELGPVLLELRERGVEAGIVFPAAPGVDLLTSAARFTDTCYVAEDQWDGPVKLIFSMIDWGLAEPIVRRAQSRRIPVVSKVEGTQDFSNRETPHSRLPYSVCDYLLCQGNFDADRAAARRSAIVGSSRLERLRTLDELGLIETIADGPVINANFSYGVLSVWAKPWYALAAKGVELSGHEVKTSVHPAVSLRGMRGVSPWPLALDIEISSHLITRRSAAILDALVLGRPAIFFNPHREPVWGQVDWNDVVPQARTPGALAHFIRELDPGDDSQVSERRAFVAREFVSFDGSQTSAVRSVDAITEWMR